MLKEILVLKWIGALLLVLFVLSSVWVEWNVLPGSPWSRSRLDNLGLFMNPATGVPMAANLVLGTLGYFLWKRSS